MKILVLESDAGVADQTVQQLEQAGHQVARCHEAGGAAFPCAALSDPHSCPAEHGVDVTLLVRSEAATTPSTLEDGVSCAIRRRLPVVVAGDTDDSPFAPFATVVSGDVVTGVEQAARGNQAGHAEAARGALTEVLELAGVDPADVEVQVFRHGTDLKVILHLPAGMEAFHRQAAAVRAAGAVRAFDPYATRIDVDEEAPA